MIPNDTPQDKRRVRAPLIIDPDLQFLETLQSTPHPSRIKPLVASDGKQAQTLLSDGKLSLSGVFVNPDITRPGGISVIRCSRLNKPATPIFLINNGESPFDAQDLHSLGVQKELKKPLTLQDIMGLIAPSAFFFEADPSKIESDSEAIDSTVLVEDAKFSPIRATDFLSGTTSYFDVYVRLNANKHIKILKAGDKFLPERIQSYLEKGVINFYILRTAQEHYISYCDKLSSNLLKNNNTSVSVTAKQVLNHGDETLKFLKDQGLSEVNLQYATQFIGNVNTLVKRLNPGKQPLLKGFLADVTSYDHGVGTTMIASLLIPAFNITSMGPVETIGLSGLMHDIGLHKLNIKTEDISKMTQEEVKNFKTHPQVSSEILGSINGISPATLQAVLQHHERRNKKGFPFQLGAGSISLIAEIIGISDEFFRLSERLKSGEQLDLYKEMKANIFDGFSPKLVTEFKRIFMNTGHAE